MSWKRPLTHSSLPPAPGSANPVARRICLRSAPEALATPVSRETSVCLREEGAAELSPEEATSRPAGSANAAVAAATKAAAPRRQNACPPGTATADRRRSHTARSTRRSLMAVTTRRWWIAVALATSAKTTNCRPAAPFTAWASDKPLHGIPSRHALSSSLPTSRTSYRRQTGLRRDDSSPRTVLLGGFADMPWMHGDITTVDSRPPSRWGSNTRSTSRAAALGRYFVGPALSRGTPGGAPGPTIDMGRSYMAHVLDNRRLLGRPPRGGRLRIYTSRTIGSRLSGSRTDAPQTGRVSPLPGSWSAPIGAQTCAGCSAPARRAVVLDGQHHGSSKTEDAPDVVTAIGGVSGPGAGLISLPVLRSAAFPDNRRLKARTVHRARVGPRYHQSRWPSAISKATLTCGYSANTAGDKASPPLGHVETSVLWQVAGTNGLSPCFT